MLRWSTNLKFSYQQNVDLDVFSPCTCVPFTYICLRTESCRWKECLAYVSYNFCVGMHNYAQLGVPRNTEGAQYRFMCPTWLPKWLLKCYQRKAPFLEPINCALFQSFVAQDCLVCPYYFRLCIWWALFQSFVAVHCLVELFSFVHLLRWNSCGHSWTLRSEIHTNSIVFSLSPSLSTVYNTSVNHLVRNTNIFVLEVLSTQNCEWYFALFCNLQNKTIIPSVKKNPWHARLPI